MRQSWSGVDALIAGFRGSGQYKSMIVFRTLSGNGGMRSVTSVLHGIRYSLGNLGIRSFHHV